MRPIALAALLLASAAFGQSVTLRNTAGTVQADVRTTDPVAGTAGAVVRVVPNAGIAQPVSESGAWTMGINTGSNTIGSVKITDGTTVAGVIVGTTALKGDVSSIAGTATSTGNGASGAGVIRVTLASDSTGQVTLAAGANVIGSVSQNGSWTVQPGNTANTTAWLTTQGGNAATFNGQSSVTTSAAALATNSAKTLCLKSFSTNTDVVYLGSSSGVTSGNGFPLYPGDSLCLSVANENLVFAISGSGTQTLGALGTI